MVVEHNWSDTQWDWEIAGLVHNGPGTHKDWDMKAMIWHHPLPLWRFDMQASKRRQGYTSKKQKKVACR